MRAVALLEKEGRAALPKMQGRGSEFVFNGAYIVIHTIMGDNSYEVMHPLKSILNGKNVAGLKDKNGKEFIKGMNKIAKEKGEGWYEYVWPVPGSTVHEPKVAFVKKATVEGFDMVVTSGISGWDMEKLNKALNK